MPIPEQMAILAALEPGWLNGEGTAFDHAALKRISICLEAYEWGWDLPRPFIYPTVDGQVRAEWNAFPRSLLLTFAADGRSADLEAIQQFDGDIERATYAPLFANATQLGDALHGYLSMS